MRCGAAGTTTTVYASSYFVLEIRKKHIAVPSSNLKKCEVRPLNATGLVNYWVKSAPYDNKQSIYTYHKVLSNILNSHCTLRISKSKMCAMLISHITSTVLSISWQRYTKNQLQSFETLTLYQKSLLYTKCYQKVSDVMYVAPKK